MTDIANETRDDSDAIDFVALAAGSKIGRYEVLSILGQGGFGITYRARDLELDRDVAIKEFLPTALAIRKDGVTVLPRSTRMVEDFTGARDRFVAEGRTLASLHHAPAIVRVFDFLQANGTAYLVMELLSGETLENRLKKSGPLTAADIDRILWPLLDGLEQVHGAGFLHRDIKPANILLDAAGRPSLIDFGAARAAMAGGTQAMTAIFTPGYAAAEQFTSAKQGPWTDIYGLAATLYHAIAGKPPPSAFDRMLDDGYEPLVRLAPPGISAGLRIGIDAGLAVRASDRPQSIAGWRAILGHTSAPNAEATMVLARPAEAGAGVGVMAPRPSPSAAPPPAAAKRGVGTWVVAAVAVLLLAGGSYYVVTRPPAVDPVATAEAQKARQQLAVADAARRKAEEETAKLRAEATRLQKAAADAEVAETALHLATIDRQHVQVALTALGFNTGVTGGNFGTRTREMIAAWQKSRNNLQTGFLTGAQNQALLREAMPAISRFDDEQKKLEDARKKADEEKARADAATKPPPVPAPVAAPVAAAPGVASATPKAGADGVWRGLMHCTAVANGGDLNIPLVVVISGGSGTWVRPGAGPATVGNHSVTVAINGTQVGVSRVFLPGNAKETKTAHMAAAYDGKNTIGGAGPERNGGGRTCDISLSRAP